MLKNTAPASWIEKRATESAGLAAPLEGAIDDGAESTESGEDTGEMPFQHPDDFELARHNCEHGVLQVADSFKTSLVSGMLTKLRF